MNKVISNETTGSRWKSFYKVGSAAAFIAAALLLVEIVVFTIWPQPGDAAGYFLLFQDSKLIGLLDFYLLEFFTYILFVPVFLAIYAAIRRVNESYMALALVLAVAGVAVFLATNNPFSMLSLSNQYAAAATEVQKELYLAAGQAILVNTNQRAVEGFNIGFFLLSTAGLIISIVMLRSKIFGKTIAYIGILTFAGSLIDYVRVIFWPSLTLFLLIIAVYSGFMLLVWLVMIARRLLKLGQRE